MIWWSLLSKQPSFPTSFNHIISGSIISSAQYTQCTRYTKFSHSSRAYVGPALVLRKYMYVKQECVLNEKFRYSGTFRSVCGLSMLVFTQRPKKRPGEGLMKRAMINVLKKTKNRDRTLPHLTYILLVQPVGRCACSMLDRDTVLGCFDNQITVRFVALNIVCLERIQIKEKPIIQRNKRTCTSSKSWCRSEAGITTSGPLSPLRDYYFFIG